MLKKENLIGVKVNNVYINDDNTIVKLDTDKGDVFLSWWGDCCSLCYLAHISGSEVLKDATILDVQHSEWEDIGGDGYYVMEKMGSTIKTIKGWVTLETRLEHNGYYGGTIEISTKFPVSQYGSSLKSKIKYKLLKDF